MALAVSEEPRTEHVVGLAGLDRREQRRDLRRVVLEVGVEVDGGAGVEPARRFQARPQRGAKTAVALVPHDEVGPGAFGDLGGAVRGTVVDDDHGDLAEVRARDAGEDVREHLGLVVRRDDDRERPSCRAGTPSGVNSTWPTDCAGGGAPR